MNQEYPIRIIIGIGIGFGIGFGIVIGIGIEKQRKTAGHPLR